ncbi:MAG: 30S ribosome-binding factor RbfA [Candidatus Liptonbacteria bacterium]|nr:30S ribosome-binding factor RbfA [Candidatus Liptonbacteria bacterium]
MKFRRERLSNLIREKVAKIVSREVEFPEGKLVTITQVNVSKDLREAVVKFNVFPSDDKIEGKKILNTHRNFIQSRLFKTIEIAVVPKIRFEYDKGAENIAVIEKIILKG